jgi:hypothetical protein
VLPISFILSVTPGLSLFFVETVVCPDPTQKERGSQDVKSKEIKVKITTKMLFSILPYEIINKTRAC